MTEVAQRRAITTLARLRDEGHAPEAVLNQSIVNGWKGVFPVKQHSGSESRRFNATVEALQSLFGEDDGSQDVSAGDGLPGGCLRHGAVEATAGGVLGSDAGPEGRAVHDSG